MLYVPNVPTLNKTFWLLILIIVRPSHGSVSLSYLKKNPFFSEMNQINQSWSVIILKLSSYQVISNDFSWIIQQCCCYFAFNRTNKLRTFVYRMNWYLNEWILVFNNFSNISAISWRPVLVVEEARVPGENHRPWASNW